MKANRTHKIPDVEQTKAHLREDVKVL